MYTANKMVLPIVLRKMPVFSKEWRYFNAFDGENHFPLGIYKYQPVLEIEAAGFEVVNGLLEILFDCCFEQETAKRKKIKELFPQKIFLKNPNDKKYEQILYINDYISGMTDNYAISIFRKIKGISLPQIY